VVKLKLDYFLIVIIYGLYSYLFFIGVGLATSVCPLYVGEMSSNKLRGRLGSLFELGLTLGIFISYIVCYLLLLRDSNDYIARGKKPDRIYLFSAGS
jgi:hypothetical protein